ncbi:MAG: MBL fold metallo-hydrolase [Treponema sp.]|jgi:glyoxylase-like metal-dependent hydrolase (beta-lactamase superfamily II)|nr:MBL fold metallo-hydrolase [Treponema sp.]
MKLFFHYCTFGFSNCYVLGTDFEKGGDKLQREAVIVDPGNMDEAVLSFIEDNDYTLRGILVTHDHLNHVHGLRTLKRIYNAPIYGMNPVIRDYRTIMVKDGETLGIGPFQAEIIGVPGHSADSAVYKIGRLLFSGDALSAGMVGRTASSYAAANQISALRTKIFALPGDYVVLPGHGPPTTLEAERRFNRGVQFFEEQKKKRPAFKIDSY